MLSETQRQALVNMLEDTQATLTAALLLIKHVEERRPVVLTALTEAVEQLKYTMAQAKAVAAVLRDNGEPT